VKIIDTPNHHKSIGYSVSFSHSEKSIELSSCNLSAIHIHVEEIAPTQKKEDEERRGIVRLLCK
jgi:hypothetical protein